MTFPDHQTTYLTELLRLPDDQERLRAKVSFVPGSFLGLQCYPSCWPRSPCFPRCHTEAFWLQSRLQPLGPRWCLVWTDEHQTAHVKLCIGFDSNTQYFFENVRKVLHKETVDKSKSWRKDKVYFENLLNILKSIWENNQFWFCIFKLAGTNI